MGCLKLAHNQKNDTVLRCVWNREKESKTHVNLYDYGARFYDPQIGRFTTIDPLAQGADNITPYHYCLNNPLTNIDPTGMWTETTTGYTTSDPQEIAEFFQQFGGQQDPKKQNSDKKDEKKDDGKDSKKNKDDKEKPLTWVQKQLFETLLAIDKTINFWSDYLGGPEGNTMDKLQYWTYTYATSQILVTVGRGTKAFKREVKIPEGFQEVKGEFSHGAPVFKKGNLYISPDIDGHNPKGIWKAATSVENLGKKETRLGTSDANLKKIGD